jgi:hypothetical protein
MSALSSASVVHIAADVATVLFGVAIMLQLLLAAGILPISMAWGGQRTVLTTGLRLASLVAALILGFFAYVVRRRAGLVGGEVIPTSIRILSWFITAFLALNTVGNLASRSIGEKLLFGPITLVLAVVCFVVSSSKT